MLAANHAGDDIGSDASADFDGAAGTLNDHPLLVLDAEARGAIGMNIRRRLRRGFAQAWQRTLLAMHESGELCVGEHQRIVRRHLRAAHRAQSGFHVFGHRRISMGRKLVTIELNLL
jgi:hypothetical protein